MMLLERCSWSILTTVLAACATCQFVQGAIADEKPRQPNIIFIMADDLGYGDLGAYGQQKLKTPNIDRLAADGMRFTDFYSGSTVCAPSRCVLMTGLHTGHCHIRGNADAYLQAEHITVAEVLKGAGYTTGLSGKWGLGDPGTPGIPTRQGFDHFFGYLNHVHAHNYFPAYLYRGEERVPLRNVVPGEGDYGSGVATKRVDYSSDLIVQDALEFIAKNKAAPFFLFLSYTIPHANNEAEDRGMEINDVGVFGARDWPAAEQGFAAMMARLDSDIGRLMQQLGTLGIDQNTVVFFTSDNGPHEEGGHDPLFFDSNGPLRGIKRTLYEGGIRIPMIVRWPGHVPAGTTSSHAAYFADFLPTAAEIAGVEPPPGLDGKSFLPAAVGREQAAHELLYWEFYEGGFSQAVRFGRWKAVRAGEGDKPIEIYDLETDPGEHVDVAAAHPDLVARAQAYMAREHVPSPLWVPEARED
jgi:arylsulfatase A-like enzyme